MQLSTFAPLGHEGNMPIKVTVLSGVPGSGKSTWAEEELKKGRAIICSTDDFFKRKNGVYEFDASQLSVAHGWNLKHYIDVLQNTSSSEDLHLIVDNTNLSVAEIAPYYAVAQAFDVKDIQILRFHPDATVEKAMEFAARNKHGVSVDGVLQMRLRMLRLGEFLPPWWQVQSISP